MQTFKNKFSAIFLSIMLALSVGASIASADHQPETIHETDEVDLAACDADETHVHTYTNESTPRDGWSSWAFAYKFRIYLHDDFVENVDFDEITCSSGSGQISCDNGWSYADGGTRIMTYLGTGDSDALHPNYIEWTYGINTTYDVDPDTGEYNGLPAMPGFNDYDGDENIDTDEEWQRTMGENIYFVFDGEESIASASTTAAVYIHFFEYNESSHEWEAVREAGHTDVHWNNDTDLLITNYSCETFECTDLEITPFALSVDDVFSTREFNITATHNPGGPNPADSIDITDDLTFEVSATDFDGNTAIGQFQRRNFGFWRPIFARTWTGADQIFRYSNAQPGDQITVQGYLDGIEQESCVDVVQYPYCIDLDITNPSSNPFGTGGGFGVSFGDEYNATIEVEARANNGQEWPYDITYSSTDAASEFSGATDPAGNPYTAARDESTPPWTINYVGQNSARVDVDAEFDVALACSDQFSYTLASVPEVSTPACLEAHLITQPVYSETELESDQMIEWASFMTDGSPELGPWFVYTSDGSGSFTEADGVTPLPALRVGTTDGFLASTSRIVLLAGTLTPGESIFIENMDTAAPVECDLVILSELGVETPFCEELVITSPSTIIPVEDIGDVDITWEITMSDGSAFSGEYLIEAFDIDGFSLDGIRGTFTDPSGTEVGIGRVEPYLFTTITYSGEAGDSIRVTSLDHPDCLDSIGSLGFCEDLTLGAPFGRSSDGTETPVDLSDDDLDSFEEVCWPITVDMTHMRGEGIVHAAGLESAGSSTLVGTVRLDLGDIAESTSTDYAQVIVPGGHEHSGEVCWTGFSEGNVLDIFVEALEEEDASACTAQEIIPSDTPVTPPGGGGGGGGGGGTRRACTDLDVTDKNADDAVVGEDYTTTVEIKSNDFNQDLIVEYSCEDKEISVTGTDELGKDYSRSTTDGKLEIENFDKDATFEVTFEEVCEDAHFEIYVQFQNSCDWEADLNDPVCEIEFEDFEVEFDEDYETCLDIDNNQGPVEVNVEYSCPDGVNFIEYDGKRHDGALSIDGYDDDQLCVNFMDFCPGAEIYADIEDDLFCSDELSFAEAGEFKQYIFTFNFAVEKNAYTDEGVFWSHDEDRAFYTSEYKPSGTEDSVLFRADMWDAAIPGSIAAGNSGGHVELADSYSDLTSGKLGEAYGYSTIAGFGFGNEHELYSNELVYTAQEMMDAGYNFVAYVKYPSTRRRESQPIPECEYDIDEDTGEEFLDSDGVCFDPEVRPEEDGGVLIENAGRLYDEFGEGTVIRVRTVGIVDSRLDCSRTDECNTEQFINNAWVETQGDELEDESRLVVLCPYLITRNAGDVYLEVELESGSNIACVFDDEESTSYSGTYANTDSLVVLEVPDETSVDPEFPETDTWQDENFTSYEIDVDICESSDADSVVGNLSSYVCEIVTEVSELWKSVSIEQRTDDRVNQSIKNAITNQNNTVFTSFEKLQNELTNQNNRNSGVLYYDGRQSGDLTIGGPNFIVPEGAWTLIVENATLNIAGNIQYASTSNFSNVPSIAFIVSDGNIHIKKNAAKLVGVYYTNKGVTGDERSPVDDPLKISGSVYGNIQNLLDAAQYVGSPNLDEGGVVIRYDSRILLNTPPGLSEYVDVSTQNALN